MSSSRPVHFFVAVFMVLSRDDSIPARSTVRMYYHPRMKHDKTFHENILPGMKVLDLGGCHCKGHH